jgi:hypothetical protein
MLPVRVYVFSNIIEKAAWHKINRALVSEPAEGEFYLRSDGRRGRKKASLVNTRLQ